MNVVIRVLPFTLLLLSAVAMETGLGQEITIAFAGEVESFSDELLGSFQIGETLQGNFTYDLTTPALLLPSGVTQYDGAVVSLMAQFQGGYEIAEGGDDDLFVNDGPPTNDVLTVFSTNPNADPVIGLPLGAFILGLIDTSSTVFSGAELPTMAPDLAAFDFRDGRLIFLDPGNGNKVVEFSITSLRTVPEPGSLMLWSVAAALLGWARTRRRL